jgi:hypothetical protein
MRGNTTTDLGSNGFLRLMGLLASVRLFLLITVVDPAKNPLLPKSVVGDGDRHSPLSKSACHFMLFVA